MKTNKSFSKRLKVTKNGKIKARKAGQNHFNSKESGSTAMNKKRQMDFPMSSQERRRFITK